jgi:amino acid transporter/mannitol/fructose-specific phosphotransferase system IIA component
MASTTAHLHKGLGLGHVFCIATGAMISSGLFVLPGMAHAMAGPGVIWSYLLAGLLAMVGALSLAELTSAMPKAGGDYFVIMRGFGPGVGTVAGLLTWFSLSLKSAFAIVGMATFAALIVHIHGLLAGAILCLLFVGLNVAGVREAARLQVLLVIGLLALLVTYIAVGIPQIKSELLVPFAPYGLVPIFTATGFVFVAYGGLLNVASVAEEVRKPGRVIPLGLALSLTTGTVVYTLAVVVTSGVLESEVLDGSLTPISDGGRAIMGQAGYIAMTVGAVLAFVSTANAGIMSASRYLLALSRDRLLPEPLSRVNSRFKTPHVAIAITGGIIFLTLLVRLDVLVEAASTVLLLTNILACLAVVVMRESGLQNYRPAFKVPLYPWLQVGGIVGLGFVLFEMGEEAYFVSAALIFIGFGSFWFYGRRRVKQESALLHLIERVTETDKGLVSGTLEEELKNIIHERDEVVKDRFDRLIEGCVVLDVEGPLKVEEFFDLVAEQFARRVGTDAARLASALKKREAESGTALNDWIAVPHVFVEGTGTFDILMARSRGGVSFSEQAPEVNAIFALVGSLDERNLYLTSLAAIAQIAGNAEFLERWLRAKGPQGLRDVVLLGDRMRNG